MRVRVVALGAAVAFLCSLQARAVTYIQGFDVYNGDGATNFYTAANGGYQFAFVKATEGVNFVDASYTTFMLNAYQVNDPSLHTLPTNPFYIGPYHFVRADSKDGVAFTSYDGQPFTPNATDIPEWQDATSEANDFIDAIRPYYYRTFSGYKSTVPTYFLPPVADVERYPNFSDATLKKTFISNWTQLFSDVVYDALGVRPIIYTSESHANENFTPAVAASHQLWEAWWKLTGTSSPPLQSNTPNWPLWKFWQWSDGADSIAQANQVPGTSVSVDRDVFNGTTPSQLAAQKMPNLVAGDNNHNGGVDGADYVTWRKAMSSPLYSYYSTVYLAADADRNDVVNAADYTYWRSQFGKTLSGSGSGSEFESGAVPEPWSLSLLLSGLFGSMLARPRR
jgi:GH25 family lysozyme M1 (1,4-beta-N-acetylmuramidase)